MAANALSSGRGGGGGGFVDRRTTMNAIQDDGLGMSEKPDWIVVRRSMSGGGCAGGSWYVGQWGGDYRMQSDMTIISSATSYCLILVIS